MNYSVQKLGLSCVKLCAIFVAIEVVFFAQKHDFLKYFKKS